MNSSITFVTDEEDAMTLVSKAPYILAAALAVTTITTSAETPKAVTNLDPVCPVQLTQLRIENNKLIFRNKNTSGVYIKKIVVGAAYLDRGNVQHPIEVQGGWKDLHAGFVLDSALDIKPYSKTGYSGWAVWPEKVMFSDGSLWQINHATTSCGLRAWKTNQADITNVPVQIAKSEPASGGN